MCTENKIYNLICTWSISSAYFSLWKFFQIENERMEPITLDKSLPIFKTFRNIKSGKI